MIIVPMPWHAVPEGYGVVIWDGATLNAGEWLTYPYVRLLAGNSYRAEPYDVFPVLVYSDAELTAQAIATIARYFTIESVTVEGS